MKQETPGREVRESPGFIRGEKVNSAQLVEVQLTMEQRDAARDEHGRRMAEIHAAEAVDPALRWVRLAERAATEAATLERLIPPEGLAVYRQKFDEIVARERQRRGE